MIDDDVIVRLIDFPTCACGGFVTENIDGTYNVFLNARLSHDQNRDSLQHELNHIRHDDFHRNVSVLQKEFEAG